MDLTRYDPATGKLNRCYRKWSGMIQRCTNPNHGAYKYYGGAGVQVCERWRTYNNFWIDMGNPPDGHWLDRIDNSKGYEPGNCRWVTSKESAQNRRQRGKVPGSIKDKARKAGLPYMLVYLRLRTGWPEALALSTPKLACGRHRPDEAWT